MYYPFPSSIPNFLFNWKLVCPLPQKAVVDGIRPMDVEYAALALLIHPFISVSDPRCSSMMLPKYVNTFTSSKEYHINLQVDEKIKEKKDDDGGDGDNDDDDDDDDDATA
ncbi:unnamed protein product [Schistosoma curassoni]|uniref:Rho-GAP domain-containing protein n=1 Tax=Schistosoma curassoni TaxID=6186 RepID=A0A183K117_9TREM|nr:unnamed protein product [Schistosoma curassoni]